MKKVQDDVIIESYKRLKNVWSVGKEVGLCGQSVHERCVKFGIIEKDKYHKWQIDFVEKHYNYYVDRFMLKELAEILDIDKGAVIRICKKLGIKRSYSRIKITRVINSEIYSIYAGARLRCSNIKCKNYKNYGGRGIEFKLGTLEEFIEKMGTTYKKGLSLDRIDVNGNYEYGNIRWATSKQQSRNTRRNLFVMYNGEKRLLIEIAEEHGIKPDTLRKRIYKYKMTLYDAINKPISASSILRNL